MGEENCPVRQFSLSVQRRSVDPRSMRWSCVLASSVFVGVDCPESAVGDVDADPIGGECEFSGLTRLAAVSMGSAWRRTELPLPEACALRAASGAYPAATRAGTCADGCIALSRCRFMRGAGTGRPDESVYVQSFVAK